METNGIFSLSQQNKKIPKDWRKIVLKSYADSRKAYVPRLSLTKATLKFICDSKNKEGKGNALAVNKGAITEIGEKDSPFVFIDLKANTSGVQVVRDSIDSNNLIVEVPHIDEKIVLDDHNIRKGGIAFLQNYYDEVKEIYINNKK